MYRLLSTSALAVAALMLQAPATLNAQMLTGCRLVEGTLQCVPGLTTDPQRQIQILKQQISDTQQLAGSIEQTIEGLEGLQLRGEARAGSLLTASVEGALANPLVPSIYHWYQRAPGEARWVLIESATGSTFTPGEETIGQSIMVVLVVVEPDGVKRASSPPVGPVQPGD